MEARLKAHAQEPQTGYDVKSPVLNKTIADLKSKSGRDEKEIKSLKNAATQDEVKTDTQIQKLEERIKQKDNRAAADDAKFQPLEKTIEKLKVQATGDAATIQDLNTSLARETAYVNLESQLPQDAAKAIADMEAVQQDQKPPFVSDVLICLDGEIEKSPHDVEQLKALR
eukprot:39140_1